MDKPDSFEFSILEIKELSGWPDPLVEDYRSIFTGLSDLTDAINNIAAVTQPPATASSTGTAGQIAFDASFFYVCIATDTWLRAGLVTW